MHTELPAPMLTMESSSGRTSQETPRNEHPAAAPAETRENEPNTKSYKNRTVWWAGCGSLWSCWMLWSHCGRVSNVTPESEASSQNHHHHHHQDSATLKHVTSPAPTDSARPLQDLKSSRSEMLRLRHFKKKTDVSSYLWDTCRCVTAGAVWHR